MKLSVEVNEVVMDNTGKVGEFRIRQSAKAFKILSDGLYSNKIRAIIRELSCNAIDSHVAAGKADVPFEVHLPSAFEPWFHVKDFGLGLDDHQVTNIYTTYFESTKTDSNDFVGALGLGSKSPFSYTENFTITAIRGGMKRIYSAFINEKGVPCVTQMSEGLTDEGNGVEVRFGVTERQDFRNFITEAMEVFKWFKNKPTVIGVSGFALEVIEYQHQDICPGIHLRPGQGYYAPKAMAVMGNIAYPLNNVPDAAKREIGDLSRFFECPLVIEFAIGDLDFAASREQLSFVPVTIQSIKRRLEELNNSLTVVLTQKASVFTNMWEKAAFLYTETRSPLFGEAVKAYVKQTKFPLWDSTTYHGQKNFDYPIEDLIKRGLEIKGMRSNGNGMSRIAEVGQYNDKHQHIKVREIPVAEKVVFVLNDLKTGCAARARYHYSKVGDDVTVFCISHNAVENDDRQKEYDKFLKEIYNPPVVVKASTLEKPPRAPAVPTTGIMVYKRHGRDRSAYVWVPFEGEIDENVTYRYVRLSGNQPLQQTEDKPLDVRELKHLMRSCGLPGLQNLTIYGVRKSRLAEIKELDNWVYLEDKLREEVATVKDENIISLVAPEVLDDWRHRVHTSSKLAKLVDAKSPYALYVEKVSKIAKATSDGNIGCLSLLCQKYGKSTQAEEVKKKLADERDAIKARYPMLAFVDTEQNDKIVAEYINLIDKQEKVSEQPE